MKRSAFSLMEILCTLIIMGIIATIAFPTYQSFIEDSHARVCETNLRALKTALDIYAMDHDTMPGALGALPQEYINKAYAQVMERKDAWKAKLAYAILEWSERGLAYAADPNFLYTLAKGNIRLITCPNAAQSPIDAGGGAINTPSYGINGAIAGITSLAYRAIPANTTLISDLVPRHIRVFRVSAGRYYSISISRGGTITHHPD